MGKALDPAPLSSWTNLAKLLSMCDMLESGQPGKRSTRYPPAAVQSMPLKVVAAARAHDLCSDTARYIPIGIIAHEPDDFSMDFFKQYH